MSAAGPQRAHLHEYHSWKCMLSRCRNPRNPSWQYYGAKGVCVCDRWQQSFAAFLADVGPAPTPEHQIDRIENDQDYEPGNVVWSTPAEQQANTSKVVFLTVCGVTLPQHVWANLFRLPVGTLRARIKAGWTADDAVRLPCQAQFRQRQRGWPAACSSN